MGDFVLSWLAGGRAIEIEHIVKEPKYKEGQCADSDWKLEMTSGPSFTCLMYK